MSAISFIATLVLAPVVLITAFFGIEVFAGLVPLRSRALGSRPVRSAIIVPANNEEAVIGLTVAQLEREKACADTLFVVADNCADLTADRAAAAGAKVLVRNDPERRGKGYALAFAREHLQNEPPEVVLIVDADCRTDSASLLALSKGAAEGRACQAVYLFEPVLNGSAVVQISTFAFTIKNLVRQRGLQRLAGRAHLTGTGMALPWETFATVDLGGSNIVEDLALGLELAERGQPPIMIEDAVVWSPTASAAGTIVQRRRWEGGYLATALKTAPRAFGRSLVKADVRGMVSALDLATPPLALLFLLNSLALLIALAATLAGATIWPLVIQLVVGAFAGLALLLAWWREGRQFISGRTLLQLPLYVLWKVPMYLGLVRHGSPKEWLRTGR